MAFKLNESAVSEVEQVCAEWDSVTLSNTAGLIQLSYTQDPAMLAEAILDRYYKDRRAQPKAMKSGCLNISASIVDTLVLSMLSRI